MISENHQAIWAAIRKLRTFSMPDLRAETGVLSTTVRNYVGALESAKYVRRISAEGEKILRFEMVDGDVVASPPRVWGDGRATLLGRARREIWRLMQGLPDFSAQDLVIHGAKEASVRLAAAREYIRYLHRAGYLSRISPPVPQAGRFARYRLVPSRYSGPLSPEVRFTSTVWDPNLKRVAWEERDE